MTKTLSPPSIKSKPPRVSVPVAADVLAIFERLAKAGNMSTGRAMAEWLADTVDAAELMASTMERARAAPKIVTAELHAMVLGMADITKEMSDKYSRFKGSLDEAAADNGGRPRAGGTVSGADEASERAIPPSCNTGGKVPTGGKGERGIKFLSTLGKTSISKAKNQSSPVSGLTSPKSKK